MDRRALSVALAAPSVGLRRGILQIVGVIWLSDLTLLGVS